MDQLTDVTLDFETYYDDKYSLKKLSTVSYVRDPQFRVHGCAIKIGDGVSEWLRADEVRERLVSIGAPINLIGQNTYFDGLVLFTHYQWVPARYSDTLSMARAVLHHQRNHDLDSTARLLGFEGKLQGVLKQTKGIRELDDELWTALGVYACNDTDQTRFVYNRLLPAFPEDELKLIDLTLRWCCTPSLLVDVQRARRARVASLLERRAKVQACGVSTKVLSSNKQFVEYLATQGVEVPTKISPATGKPTPALSQSDLEFQDLMAAHPELGDVWDARQAVKSTITATRAKTLADIGMTGPLPMPLKYYGAHTGRWSGHDGLNPQNFTRGSEIRKSIMAPPGYVILVADLKQIELRMNMWFCDEAVWLSRLRAGHDVYRYTAADYFVVPLDEVDDEQRFVGKTMELGLGYRMGWKKFRRTMALKGVYLTETEAYRAVISYRSSHPHIKLMWEQLDNYIGQMYQGNEIEFKSLVFQKDGVALPNGMLMDYPDLQPTEEGNWIYFSKGKPKPLHGGSFLENIIQALARVVIGEQALAVHALPEVSVVSSTHDELLMLVREKYAEQAKAAVTAVMTTPPAWAPELPLDVEIGYATTYSK